jgi:DMSO/TMAO reductase YedYZ molybdopterin-dependent catalytic subunit
MARGRSWRNHAHVQDERHYGRAAFLAVSVGGLSSLFWAQPVWHAISKAGAGVSLPGGSGGWRIYTVASTMPSFDRRTWRLTVGGLVDKPLRLTYDDLLALPKAEQVSDFHCVTGWTVKNVRWGGVRFHDLLAAAGVKPTARALTFVSAEKPYTDSLTLDQALSKDTMLAYEMDGGPLPRVHGAPVRVVMPRMYGYKNTKWVERIVVARGPIEGYWEQRGYDRDAWVGHSNEGLGL